MPALSKEDKLRLLTTMLESRHADLREQNLNRQGKGHFHVSGMGHEALAAVSFFLGPGEYIGPDFCRRGGFFFRGGAAPPPSFLYFSKNDNRNGGGRKASN